MRRGFAATTSGHYGEAILLFQKGFDLSRSQGDPCTAAWFLNNIAGAHFRLFRYRQALAAYLEERPHALRCGDSTSQGSLALNISSLYARMENLEAAVAAADESLQYFSRNSNSPYRASALVNRARLYARERNPSAAIDTYLAGLEESRRHFDPSQPGRVREYVDLQVVGWTELGRVYLERREFDRAEHALLEAYRVQRVHRFSPTNTTYRDLAFLERARGDTPAALRLMDRAVAKGLAAPRAPLFLLLRDRGRLRNQAGDRGGALDDYLEAVRLIRKYRLNILPADAFRQSTENHMHEVYSEFISLATQISYERNDRKLALITFQIAEENRAASLRALERTPEEWHSMLPADYWPALAQLHSEEAALLRASGNGSTGQEAGRSRIQELNLRLTELEARAGLQSTWDDADTSAGLRALGGRLSPHSALLSIHLGESQSHLWVLAKDCFEYHRLPPRREIAAAADRFKEAVRAGDPDASRAGETLYRALFASIPAGVSGKRDWILAVDSDLIRVPWPALVAGRRPDGGPVYLVEERSLRLVPGAAFLADREKGGPRTTPPPRRLLAVGDAVYNQADPRAPQPVVSGFSSALLMANPAPTGGLPRLAGSALELDQCARLWRDRGGSASVLSGAEANPVRLTDEVTRGYDVLHVAAHFLPSPAGRDESQIALSLSADGTPRLLAPRTIQNLRTGLRTVVLNGCGSGNGAAPSATGLLGMTRAWLAAGSRHVVSTLWPTADDSGELFQQFYRHLLEAPSREGVPAEPVALQRAQVELIRSRSWRSQPRHWAAYFLISKD